MTIAGDAPEPGAGGAVDMEVEAFKRLYPLQFFERYLNSNVRPDGRPLMRARPTSINLGKQLIGAFLFFFVLFYGDDFGTRVIARHVMSVWIPRLGNLAGFLGLSWCFVPICRRNSYCRWFGIGEDWQHGEELYPLSPISNHSRISPFPPLPPMCVILHLKWMGL